jgi:putative pyrroloquinoline-quinone binding quinoprotein
MRRAVGLIALPLIAVACSSGHHAATPQAIVSQRDAPTRGHRTDRPRPGFAQRVLDLPPVSRGPLPGYLLVADRDNNRALLISPSKRVVWRSPPLRGPDDAFFTPGYRSIITNEEFNDTLTEVALRTRRRIWRYGHDAVPGSSAGYLNTPDDAYRLADGSTTIADIRNCRIVTLSHSKRVLRILGGSCVHDPPRGFASPNGDTPLPDGGLLVTEIGPPGWIDRLDAHGRLVWSVQSPIAYPSDAQLLPNGRILVAGFTIPGKIIELTRTGRVTWSFGAPSGPNMLAKPSLAVRFPNGLIASNDDYNHRVILIDPRTKRIVWQYGHTGVPGAASGYLDKPDGLDLLPSAISRSRAPAAVVRRRVAPRLQVRRIGALPQSSTRLAAVALPNGRILALGGLVGGTSSAQILLGTPEHLRVAGQLPTGTHDDAAVLSGGVVSLYGGGQATSSPDVVQIDPRTALARPAGRLDEPLSDLGAAVVGGRTYLVGGYTGSRYATAILRVDRGARTTTVARLPAGLRYAGVAASGSTIVVAGGVTTSGQTAAIRLVDPATGSVRRLGTLPKPVAHAPLVAFGRVLYLIGGTNAAGAATRAIYRIDATTGAVRLAGRLPVPLADAAAVTIGSRVVVLDGEAVYTFKG